MNKAEDSRFHKLVEGNIYLFRIVGIVRSPDGNEYFKLKDPNNVKHLLVSEYYRNYGFEVLQQIQCRIDRINCSGKIYIEPVHPFYEYGKYYQFPIIRFEKGMNHAGENVAQAVLVDLLGYELKIPVNDISSGLRVNDMVTAKVVRIKKGRVFVSTDGDTDIFEEINHNDRHQFQITGKQSYGNGYDFYILKDENDRKIKLRTKHYLKYGLMPGQSLTCRMIRSAGSFYFEPDHPLYQPGMEYEFEIIGQKMIENYPEGQTEVLILNNPYGKEILLPKLDESKQLNTTSTIICKVSDIRKGEPLLDYNL